LNEFPIFAGVEWQVVRQCVCWQQLAVDESAVSGVTWSVEEVKKKWTCVKSEAKNSVALICRRRVNV